MIGGGLSGVDGGAIAEKSIAEREVARRSDMDTVVEQFGSVIRHGDDTFRVYLHGRSRPRDTWQGWLVFERERDGRQFETAVETTQPNPETLRYWATGLTDTYLDGALSRALAPPAPPAADVVIQQPIVAERVGHDDREARRAALERDVLDVFSSSHVTRLLANDLFRALNAAHADVTRALEHLEKHHRLLVRQTEEGNDWIILTAAEIRATTMEGRANDHATR